MKARREPSPVPNPARPLRWRRRAVLAAVVLGVLVAALLPGGRLMGRWLMVRDSLRPSDAIFVHAGHVPFRAMEAASIFRQGWAPEVWLTPIVGTEEEEALSRLGIERPQGWYYSRQVLEKLHVPAGAIRLLGEGVANTKDEVEAVASELRNRGGRRVILVTSKQHSRRVRMLWRRGAHPSLEAVVRYAESDPFDPDGWWRNSHDAQAVLHELFGILNSWIGSPLRPERG